MAAKLYARFSFLFFILLMAHLCAHGQSMGTWSNTGPVNFPVNSSGQVNGIGRVSQIKFHPTSSTKVYAVSASGGVYLSSNNGVSWTPMAGTEVLPQTSLSSICINYANDQTLYICLGDANYYSSSYGIYKSTNGGASFSASNTGAGTAMAVEILMDPSDTNKLVAATNTGIYRTINGGSSWSLAQSGVFRDMKKNPSPASRTLFAATATAFYVSNDFGATWTQTTTGVSAPSGNGGMRIAVSAADTSRVYLATTGSNGIIFKSSNRGASFTTAYSSSTQCLVCYDASTTSGSQGDYNLDLTANPAKANELLVIAHNVWRSTDSGVTWSKRTAWYNECHTDMHHIEWNPYNNAQIWNGNDGGVWMSVDTQATVWNPRSDGLAATEVYRASQSPVTRDLISIGTQDNGELYYSSAGWKTNRGGDWSVPSTMDYRSSGTVWYMARGNRRTLVPLGSDQSYNPPHSTNTGTFISTDPTRIEFLKGLTTTAFVGNDSIYRCSNTAATTPSWQLIWATTAVLRDVESCRADSNILYVMSGTNMLMRSDNALAATPTWTALTTPGTVSTAGSLTTSRFNANVVFVSCGNAVYRSVDKGVTWAAITGTGLSGLNIRKIICDDYSPKQRLFVNAGPYVHYKDSTTTTWTNHSAIAGLPTVANGSELMIYNDGTAQSVLRLSTYGRGVWESNINNNAPPVAAFTADKTNVCPGDTVHFTQNVIGAYTSLLWTFAGGAPGTSTTANPAVVYNTPGTYSVTLLATNAFGNNTLTKTGYITVTTGQTTPVAEGFEGAVYPPANWTLANSSGYDWTLTTAASGFGASSKSIVWDNYTNDALGAHDRIISPKVSLAGVNAARLKFDVAYAPYSTSYPDSLQVKLSTDCGQTWSTIYNKTGTALATAPAYTAAVFVPTSSQWRSDSVSLTPYAGQSIILSFENIGHYGQALYLDNINIRMSPKAAFGKTPAAGICAGQTVSFSDSSTNATSWSWSFPGGTPATSSLQNPVITYSSAGTYNATLIATNSVGSDTIVKTGYVVVTSGPAVNLGNDTTICPGATITLNAGNTGSTYLYSNSATAQTTAVTTGGTYSVRVTTPSGCIGRDTIVITLASNPVVNLGNDTTLCPAATITLNAGNTGSSFLYSNAATTQTTSITAAGTYSVRVTNAAGCIGRDTIVISSGTNPVVNLGNDTTICAGTVITLNAGNAGGTYLYSTSATTQSINVSGAGAYSVRVTNGQGCIGRDTIVITTAAAPVVNLGADTTLCAGASLTLNAGNGGSTYLYSTSATTQTISVSAAGTYSVRVTNAAGCVGRDTIVVSTSANPTVNLGPDITFCVGTSVTLNAGAGFSSYLFSNSATTQTTTVSSAGTYSVRVTNAGGCIGRDTIVLTAAAAPLVNLGNDTAICPGATITLNASNAGSAFLYNTSATTQSISVTSGGTYSVRVTNAAGCVGRDTIIITQGVNPAVNLGNDTVLCPGVSLTLNAGNPGSTYLYSNAATTHTTSVSAAGTYSVRVTNAANCVGRDTIVISAGTAPVVNLGADTTLCPGAFLTLNAGNSGSAFLYSNNATTQTTTVASAGTYSVRVTNGQGCIGRDTIIIAAATAPAVNLGADTALCPGATITLDAGNAGSSFLYNTLATTQSITVSTSGTYSVRVTDAAGCVSRDTIVIAAGANPTVFLGADTALCPGATITLNAGNAGSLYLYSNAATTQSIAVTSAGTYSVRVTNAQGCIGRDTIIIAAASAPAVFLGNDTTLCPGAAISLNAGNAGSSFLYNTAATTQTISVTAAGTYSVRVTNAAGCIGRDTIVIAAGSNPAVNLGADTVLCPGAVITLNAGNAGSTYLYSNSATTQTTAVTTAGIYFVRVTNGGGCVGYDTIVIAAGTAPVVNLGRDTAICPGTSITLNAGNPGALYLYSTGATTQTILVSAAGSYLVRVTNAQHCVARDTVVVTIAPLPMAPIVAAGGVLTTGSTGISYQWYRNGVAIAGATTSAFKPVLSGSYTVEVTSPQGCKGTSPAYTFDATGIANSLAAAGYVVSPNPSDGQFTIRSERVLFGTLELSCYNAAGSLIRLETLKPTGGKLNASLDWSALPSGVYSITLKGDDGSVLRAKIVIR